jgi:hypothetical protein
MIDQIIFGTYTKVSVEVGAITLRLFKLDHTTEGYKMGAHSAHSSSDSPHSFHPTTMSYNFYHPPTVSFQERTLARFLRRINRQLVSHGPTILHFDSASGNLRPWYW